MSTELLEKLKVELEEINIYCRNICRYAKLGVVDQCDICRKGRKAHLIQNNLSEAESQWAKGNHIDYFELTS